jgi:glycosyltransferase involved in cell wall biosynthesis
MMASRQPDLSVVIPALDAADTLGEQLDALTGQTSGGPIEILVVDNGSTDQTPRIVAARAATDERIRLVSEPTPGAAAALNRGIAEARADHLAFCDSDDVVGAGWIDAARRGLVDHELVTGPLELDLLNDPDSARSRGCSWANRLERFADLFPLIPSGNFAARRDAIEAAAGFDPEIRVGYDVDFAYRAFQSGVHVSFDPNLIVHYRYRGDARGQWHQGRSMARFRPGLYRRLERDGHAVPSRVEGLANWAWMIKSLPTLRHRAGRLRWVWVAANRVGQLEGSLRARSLFL